MYNLNNIIDEKVLKFSCTIGSTNIVTITGASPTVGSILQFEATGSMPAPLSASYPYYVLYKSTSPNLIYITTVDASKDLRRLATNLIYDINGNWVSPARVFDYNITNAASRPTPLLNGAYFGLNFGVSACCEFSIIKVITQTGVAVGQNFPSNLDLEISNDNLNTWQLVESFTVTAINSGIVTLTSTNPVTADAFRLVCKSNTAQSLVIYEITAMTEDVPFPSEIDITQNSTGTIYVIFPPQTVADGFNDFKDDFMMYDFYIDDHFGYLYKEPPPANKLEDNYVYDDVTGTLVVSGGAGGPFVG